ncbi:serine/threonine-protein kinase [Streptomyces sp. Pv4-95]|uniref:serine/threonine-protein kinase n=1 Tax=Streptomyces sp. Pv4-95 TaxID=3049543 RepID=UPI0038919D08
MAESRLIQGRYRLIETIGRGGMGEVWRARDESLGRQVAVKCLKPMGPRHEPNFLQVLRERFRREARVAAALQHRGITVVHDFGEDDGTLYLVMELLNGRNLSQLLDDNRRQPLPVADVIEIAEQLTAALAYTHEQEVVHRDLKPANIVRIADGTVKICDFGIARLGHDIGFTARLTGTGIAMGTPHYMSPEQIGAGTVDHRSDLYSLGCVLYEIATGAPPFDVGDAWAVLIGHRDTTPEPLRARRADLPEAYDHIVLDLLAKDPDDRPRDADELGKRLADARRFDTGRSTAGADARRTAPTVLLPFWTRGMTTGVPASGARPPLQNPPGRATAALVHAWTTGAVPLRDAAAPAAPAPHSGRPLDRLTVLAERHGAGLDLGRGGRWAEAAEVHHAVAAERRQLLGPDHPDTLTSHFEAARALGRTGRPDAALSAFEQVAAVRTRTLGADHPDTLVARHELALGLGSLGRGPEALTVYRDLVAARTRVHGALAPETLRARHGLGVNLGRLGRWEEALVEAREVAEARDRVLGADHPDTLVSRREVAVALGWLGRWGEALGTYRRVADARERVLGAAHPDTLASRGDEAQCLDRLGRADEAAARHRRIAQLRQERSPGRR